MRLKKIVLLVALAGTLCAFGVTCCRAGRETFMVAGLTVDPSHLYWVTVGERFQVQVQTLDDGFQVRWSLSVLYLRAR